MVVGIVVVVGGGVVVVVIVVVVVVVEVVQTHASLSESVWYTSWVILLIAERAADNPHPQEGAISVNSPSPSGFSASS